jgi:hypothetical protein
MNASDRKVLTEAVQSLTPGLIQSLTLDFVQSAFVHCMRFLQISSQMYVQGDRHAHYYQRTDAKDQEPPDHPHSRLG